MQEKKKDVPAVQHSPSVHSCSEHTWLAAAEMRTFPADSHAVKLSHRGAAEKKKKKKTSRKEKRNTKYKMENQQ